MAPRALAPGSVFLSAGLTAADKEVKVLCVANLFVEDRGMDARQAAQTLEVIRTLMERTCQYQLLTARASLVAGSLAGAGALAFLVLNPQDPWQFGIIWALVFLGSLFATCLGTV